MAVAPASIPFTLLLGVLVALTALGMDMFLPSVPVIARELGGTAGSGPGAAQLTITTYLLGLAIGQLAWGPVSDRARCSPPPSTARRGRWRWRSRCLVFSPFLPSGSCSGKQRMDKVECVVIGAGVIGLAVARALALAGREVVILEAEDAIGTHTSSRNSEVIHAGIYYPKGSLKARACVEGRRRLYAYCDEHGVPYRRCGKLIVAASESQRQDLLAIKSTAHANGVADVVEIPAAQAMRMEPALRCVAALHSPATGIVDSHALMLAYLGDAEAAGAMLALKSPLKKAFIREGGFELHVENADPIRCRMLVNSAGLRAPSVARRIEGFPPDRIPPELYAKGNYYSLAGKPPFSRLIYPVPEPGGLGVHVTLDLAGQARFGPDVEWVQEIDYAIDPGRAERFYAAIRRYWPALPDGALAPGYAGIRPKISGPGEPAADFLVQGSAGHGVPGLVNLFGIESPGLTASLALADDAARLLQT